MAVSRQTDLFSGEVWQSLYLAFPSINFNATDPVSINQALQSYIQTNYPEKFNDWIISSEFVAIIDLLSWLAGTLAFKTDIAARENFLDTAESKESVLRLARFLSYNPSRCQPATGILKITEIFTDDDVYDSFGTDLINTTIVWNDPNNSNWFDQFTSILNAAFVNTNPYGIPINDGIVAGIATQLYRLNGLASNSNLGFSSTVSGTAMDFELCNGMFTSDTSSATGSLSEVTPNANLNAFQFFYLNDNNGNASPRTGFFFLFKQGTTQSQTFNIAVPIQNQLIDITTQNINQTDVWVNTLATNGNVLINWTNVPAIFNSNITYNNIPIDQRNIFTVITRDNDEITLRFSDGNFGNAPSGFIQAVYRVSNGLTYQINPSEINGIQLQLQYVNTSGSTQNLYVTFSLEEVVSNAAASETTDSIRQNAPQVYSTQGRMVSGEDYNIFPLSTNLAVKIQAINRIYSGQSRYIDLQDPTGTYQDLSIFSEDGILFKQLSDNYFSIPTILNQTSGDIISGYILPTLTQYTISNIIRDVLLQNTRYITTTVPTIMWSTGTLINVSTLGITWTTANASAFQTTGWFSQTQNLIQPGAIIQFNVSGTVSWVAVIDIQGAINSEPLAGVAGPVTLAVEVPTGAIVEAILPCSYVVPSASVISQMQTNLSNNLSFSLWYDYYNSNSVNGPTWVVNGAYNDFGDPEPTLVGTQLQIMNINYITGMWIITAQGLRYVFESVAKVEWFDNGVRALAQLNDEAEQDIVRVLKVNSNLNDTRGYALQTYYDLKIDRLWAYQDGTLENRRTVVNLNDSTGDGYPDVPDAYYQIVSNQYQDNYLFWSNAANPPYDEPLYTVVVYNTDTLMYADNTKPLGTVGFQVTSTATYINDETFWVYTAGSPNYWQQDLYGVYRMERGRGQNVAALWVTGSGNLTPSCDDISFLWKHYADSDQRIDPSSSNIIDIFVLTYAYDTAVRTWIANGPTLATLPAPPTELDLAQSFSSIEQFKMFSDEIIWRPVTYKFLFGVGANPELQGFLKVVPLTNAAVSNQQIQSGVITAVNTYFGVSNWNFGDTFFASELLAYIHQQMVNMISSVVIVPGSGDGAFGNLFEVSCQPNEIFISTMTVSSVIIISSNTNTNLRIRS